MVFAAVYVANFMVQAVVRAEPHLRERALALADGVAPLRKIVAVNEAACRLGVSLELGEAQAAQLGGLEIRLRSQSLEKTAHAALLDLGWSVSPRMEDTAPDTIVLDLAGLSSVWGSEENIAAAVAERASALGLSAQIAVAANVDTALHAARGSLRPGTMTVIPAGEESRYLGSLPVEALAPSAEILAALRRWGIHTCAALGGLPILQLSERLGPEGVRLHKLARGAVVRSLRLAQVEVCFEEEMELDYAVAELEPLAFLLGRLLGQLCARLEARSLAASAIRLQFDLERSFKKDIRTRVQHFQQNLASLTYKKILTLPVPMRDSTILLQLLRLQLQADPPHAAIVKISLAAEPARLRVAQGGLFLPASPDPEKLEVTMARVAILVGPANVGSPQLMDTHRPGEFRMSRFAPASCPSSIPPGLLPSAAPAASPAQGSQGDSQRNLQSRPPVTGFRVFRPAWPAEVELREQCPCGLRFRGLQGEVLAASGPWRTSGDWWLEQAWQQDEWDLDIHFYTSARRGRADWRSGITETSTQNASPNGVYRVYFDALLQGWFVRGRYD